MPYYPPLSSAAIIAALGYTPVNRAGDTMTGNLLISPAISITGSLFVIASGLTRALQTDQVLTGTLVGPFAVNAFTIASDDIDATNGSGLDHFVDGWQHNYDFGGSTVRGGRQALTSYLNLTTATNSANDNRNYVAFAAFATAETGDGGTSTALADAKGAMFGVHGVAVALAGATNLLAVTGAEFDVAMETGSSAWAKSILLLSNRDDDRVKGAVVDAMLWVFKGGASSPATNDGILFGSPASASYFPFDTNSTVLRTLAGTFGTGIDFTASTPTVAAIKTPGFTVNPVGDVTVAAASTSASATVSITGGSVSGFGALEIGGGGGGFIDLKAPFSDDFDLRILTDGSAASASTASGVPLVLAAGGAGNSVSLSTNGTARLIASDGNVTLSGDTLRIATAKTPASAAATGTQGDICWDANFLYTCIATDTWKRAALATW